MKKIFILFTLMLTLLGSVMAQDADKSVRGVLTGNSDQDKVAATICLYELPDSSLVKISLSGDDGKFEFRKVPEGKYYLMVTLTGHEDTFSPVFILAGTDTAIQLPSLQLKPEIKMLKGVTVSLKKPFVEQKIDRTVINVDASIMNAGTSALDVLEKAPGVSVDKEGNVSLKGKAGVLILMDGRPTYLSGPELTNLLKSMSSAGIDQIELMTNPPAKFDASGNSGIINIKTKKNRIQGLNGSATLSVFQSRYPKTSNSLNLNYKKGKVNLFANYSYTYWQNHKKQHIIRKFRNLDTKEVETIFDQVNISRNTWRSSSLKAGMDFYAGKRTTLGVVLSGYDNLSSDKGINTNHLNNGANQTDSLVVADNSERTRSTHIATNINLRHLFDSSGKEFTVDLDYLNYSQDASQLLLNDYYNADHTQRKPSSELLGSLPSVVHIYAAKTDFTFPLKNAAKMEAGLKTSFVTTDNNALYQYRTPDGYLTDEGKTNHFIYKENINSAYINFSKTIKEWGLQAGLRAENTNASGHQSGNSTHPDSSFSKEYINLFPSLYVSLTADSKNTFRVGYSRRIDRPDYEDLNPFYYFLDEYTYQVGNTLLQPQFSDNIELSHTYNGFLSTTLNYSHTSNVFTQVLKQVTSERITYQTNENLASKVNYGIAVSANFPVTSFWTTNLYTNLFHNVYSGVLGGGTLRADATGLMANMSNQFQLKKGWSAEMGGFYRSRGIEGQIIIDGVWRLDAGIRKNILKDKGSLKFSVRDIFNTQHISGRVNYQDIDVDLHLVRDSRNFSLTFSYRFGKPDKNQSRRNSGSASDEQSRVKSGGN